MRLVVRMMGVSILYVVSRLREKIQRKQQLCRPVLLSLYVLCVEVKIDRNRTASTVSQKDYGILFLGVLKLRRS
jgi:hypothetical protein